MNVKEFILPLICVGKQIGFYSLEVGFTIKDTPIDDL